MGSVNSFFTKEIAPSNITLLFATPEQVQQLRPVKVLDITDGMSSNFHPDGLFSNDIFGKPGGEFRNRRFSYVDLRVPMIHPTLYKILVRLDTLNEGIMSGKVFAEWDAKTKRFVKSNSPDAKTGFDFFVQHLPEMTFEDRKAMSRRIGVKVIELHQKQPMISRLLVLPAGLRDYVVDETGKPSEDEINNFYRKIMRLCFSLDNFALKSNLQYLDSTRYNIQVAIQELYSHIVNLLRGKKKAIQGHFTTRRTFNTTRNVITSMIPQVTELGGDKSVNATDTAVGLYQFLRAEIPLCVREVREKFSSKVFQQSNGTAVLVNPKTRKPEIVPIDPGFHDNWMTYDGLEKVFAKFGDHEFRFKTLQYKGYWMMMLYDDGTHFRLLNDIDELPEHLSPDFVRPVTLAEMLYIAVYRIAHNSYGFATRHPVIVYGGVYPCSIYLKSTAYAKVKTELDYAWQPSEIKAQEFPVVGQRWFESMSVGAHQLNRLGGD